MSLKTRDEGYLDVVSHAFCESSVADEDNVGKKTLEEVHMYAELNIATGETSQAITSLTILTSLAFITI